MIGMGALTQTAVQRAGRVQACVVLLMFGFSVMSYFDRTIMSIAGPGIMKEFGLSETEMGTVYSAFLWSYALMMIPCGGLADRLGPRLVLTGMALGAAAFTALTAWAGKPGLGTYLGIVPSFVVIRLGLGVFTAPIYPTCARMNANWMGIGQRGRVQGWVNSGAGLGGAVSPILFSWMIARYGWRISFLLAGLATAVLGAAWFFYVRDRPEEHPGVGHKLPDVPAPRRSRAPTPWRALLADRNLQLLTIGYFAVDYFEYIFFYWIFYYLGEIRGLGASESAIYTTLLFLTWLVMTPVGGWTCDRLGARYGRKAGLKMVGAGGLILAAILLFAGVNAQQTASAVGLMSLALGFASCSDVAFWAATIDVAGTEVGAAGGILNTGGNVGGSFAPVLTAFIAARAGWSWGLYFGCLMALAGVLTWLWIDPTRKIAVRES